MHFRGAGKRQRGGAGGRQWCQKPCQHNARQGCWSRSLSLCLSCVSVHVSARLPWLWWHHRHNRYSTVAHAGLLQGSWPGSAAVLAPFLFFLTESLWQLSYQQWQILLELSFLTRLKLIALGASTFLKSLCKHEVMRPCGNTSVVSPAFQRNEISIIV